MTDQIKATDGHSPVLFTCILFSFENFRNVFVEVVLNITVVVTR